MEDDASVSSVDAVDAVKTMETFRETVEGLDAAINTVDAQLAAIAARLVERPLIDRPAAPVAARAWCEQQGLGPNPTPRQFLEALLRTAHTTDLASRTIRLRPKTSEALGLPETVGWFDVLRAVPRLLAL